MDAPSRSASRLWSSRDRRFLRIDAQQQDVRCGERDHRADRDDDNGVEEEAALPGEEGLDDEEAAEDGHGTTATVPNWRKW